MMVLSVGAWIGILLLGSALVVWPLLGSDLVSSNGSTPTNFSVALYYAGYSLTTLGVGDLVPVSDRLRLFTVTLALIGFSVVTLTLTYFLSVYSALVRRNVVSQTLHHMSGGSGRSGDLVAGLGHGGNFDEARSQIATVATGVLDIVESNESYPVLQYFRMNHTRYAVARVAFLTLDTASLLRSAISPAYADLVQSAVVRLLWGSGLSLLGETESEFIWAPRSPEDPRHSRGDEDVRAHFEEALRILREAGIETADDVDEAFEAYCGIRSEWADRIVALARCTGFDWHEVSAPGSSRPASTGGA